MALTFEQKIAQKEAELARLKTAQRKLETGQKIIIGGAILSAAYKDPKIKELLIKIVTNHTNRDADKRRIRPLIEDLKQRT